MRRSAIAASLLLTISAPAFAQNLYALSDGLSHLPATILAQDHGDVAYFVDVQVVSGLGSDTPGAKPFSRVLSGADLAPLQSLQLAEPAEWEAKAGTTLDKLVYVTGYGRAPNGHTFWGLADETAVTAMIAALEARGFKTAGAPGVVGNGEPQKMDPAMRDVTDPWRTMIGAAQFAAARGSNIVQAQTPQAAMLATVPQPTLGEDPIIQTALAGLAKSIGDSQLVQAVVISPLFGMTGLDPAAILSPSADLEETKRKMAEQMTTLGSGVPPYLAGIVADVQGDTQGVGIALAYPDCAIAQQAADVLASRWVEMAGEHAQGEITADTAEGQDGMCAATLSVYLDANDTPQNPAYRAIVETHMRGQAGVLQIGAS